MGSNRKRIWLSLTVVIGIPVAFGIAHWEYISPYRSHADLRFQLTGEWIALSAALTANFLLILLTPARNLCNATRIQNSPLQNFYLAGNIEFSQLMLSWRDFFPNDQFQPHAGIRTLVGTMVIGGFLWFVLSVIPPQKAKRSTAE